jgi:hypothetical protein
MLDPTIVIVEKIPQAGFIDQLTEQAIRPQRASSSILYTPTTA